MSNKAYFARFTPTAVVSRQTSSGAAQLKARGIIENRNGSRMRTVVAYGRLHDEIRPHLEEGRPVLLKGFYENVINEDGGRGGQFFKPFAVIRTYDRPVPPAANSHYRRHEESNRSVEGHERAGHWRWQRYGKGLQLRKRIWIASCVVNCGNA